MTLNRAIIYVIQAVDGAVVAFATTPQDAAKTCADQDAWRGARRPHRAFVGTVIWDGIGDEPRKALTALANRVGVRFHPHMARHSFATELVAAGANIRDVMEAGRWRSINAVTRYIAPDMERVRKAVGRL